eukprot:jgi/Bigna1/88508/estExt_fgenesh1_pg.C_330029
MTLPDTKRTTEATAAATAKHFPSKKQTGESLNAGLKGSKEDSFHFRQKAVNVLLTRAREAMISYFQLQLAYLRLVDKQEFWMKFDWYWSMVHIEAIKAGSQTRLARRQLVQTIQYIIWKFKETVTNYLLILKRGENGYDSMVPSDVKMARVYHGSPVTPPSLSKFAPTMTDESKKRKNNLRSRSASGPNMLGKRCNFSRSQVCVLSEWLAQHQQNPYPTQDEKFMLARKTNLTVKQVANWFINTRARGKKRKFKRQLENIGVSSAAAPCMPAVAPTAMPVTSSHPSLIPELIPDASSVPPQLMAMRATKIPNVPPRVPVAEDLAAVAAAAAAAVAAAASSSGPSSTSTESPE